MSRLFPFLILLTVAVAATTGRGPAAEEALSYNFHVRPILSDRCFFCHGPDAAKQKGDLRLDQREAALRGGKSGHAAIVPGDPSKSELIRRLETTDADEKMPPADSHREVSAEEVAVLKRWVQEGAKYEPHWSLVPPVKAEVPEIPGAWKAAAVNEIDAFIAAKADSAGLEPAASATPAQRLRRVYLGLTGLPPSPGEVETFLKDPSPEAYAAVVNRLLDSPGFAERLALDWLDAARFADTYGYQADRNNHLWPWRDWVLRAFRANMPYDRFITAQLAGDLLPNATADDRLATAFNRLHRMTNEGGSVAEEMRLEGVADRVNTFGTAMLGLTLECCRCHDHKYDPVGIKEYYQIGAFFDNIDEYGVYAHFNDAEPTPAVTLFGGNAEEKHQQLLTGIAAAEKALQASEAGAAGRLAATGLKPGTAPPARPAAAGAGSAIPLKPVAAYTFDAVENGKYASSVEVKDGLSPGDGTVAVEGFAGKGVRFDGDNSLSCGGEAGKFDRDDTFTLSIRIRPGALGPRQVIAHRCAAEQDAASQGWELLLDDGHPVFSLIHFWPGDAIRVRAKQAVPAGAWSQIAVTYDGSSRAAGVALYTNGEKMELEVVRDHLTRTLGTANLALGGRFRDTGFRDGAVDDLLLFNGVLTPSEAAILAGKMPAWPAEDQLAVWRRDQDAASLEAAVRLRSLRKQENDLINRQPQIMAMAEMKPRRQSVVRVRGAYDSPGAAVSPGVPASLPPLPLAAGETADRLALAGWMTDPGNPLTARVYVNRLWQLIFGQGLVTTTNDFGMQGKLPTHPELLDWLARDFEDHGWNIRRLCGMMVMSGVYGLSSTATSDQRERDPGNALLARFPRHRLPAELVRDRALAASGLLVPTFGGPSVKPYQPAGLWEESGTGASYDQGKGDALHRRSLYTFIKRTVPPVNMLTFDSQSREVCAVKRETTNTPLQALVLLNDIQFIEAARVLAQRGLASGQELEARLRQMFVSLISREPEPFEMALMLRVRAKQIDWYAARPAAALDYVRNGDEPVPEDLSPVLLAAETAVAQMLMSYDEFVSVR